MLNHFAEKWFYVEKRPSADVCSSPWVIYCAQIRFFPIPRRGIGADKRAKFGLFIMMCVVTSTMQTHGLSCAAARYSYQGSP